MKLKFTSLIILLAFASVSVSQEDIISNKKEDKSTGEQENILTNQQEGNSSDKKENILTNSQAGGSEEIQGAILSNNQGDSIQNNQNAILSNITIDSVDLHQEDSLTNCACWDSLFSSNDSAYLMAFKEMEDNFISKGYLDSSNPGSYIHLMQVLADSNNYFLFGVDIDPMFILGFKKCFILNNCDSSEFVKIRNMNFKMAGYQNIEAGPAFRDALTVFTTKDLENIMIRHYVLTFYPAAFYTSFELPEKLMEEIPPAEKEDPVEIVKRNILYVYAAPNEKVYVNDSLTKITDLKKVVYNHISDTSQSENSPEVYEKFFDGMGMRNVSKQSITYTTDVATSYEYYSWVKDIMIEAYADRRNEISLFEYGIDFNDLVSDRTLNKVKIRTIQNLLRIRITEVEPKD